ncbi:replication initiation factor [Vitreoscilla sp. C1]|nr:replication initiation factor [Vitreoscilla sp. C1]
MVNFVNLYRDPKQLCSRPEEAQVALGRPSANFDRHLSNRWVGENLKAAADFGFDLSTPLPFQTSVAQVDDLISKSESFESFKQEFLDCRGNIVELLLKRNIEQEGAFIDQVTFTGDLESLNRRSAQFFDGLDGSHKVDTVAQRSRAISEILKEIFGFGITSQLMTSNFFYDYCFECKANEKLLYAKVHFGGQSNTFCIEVKGLGISAAHPDWNKRLFKVMSSSWFVRPKITRIDIAMDFFHDEYSPEQAREDRNNGLFNTRNKLIPKAQCIGTEWEDDTGRDKSGKTYTIGTRNSARFIRVYNKAAEQGVQGTWVRFEVEFGRKAIIPLDALVHPTDYFCGSSTAAARFTNHNARFVDSQKVKLSSTIEHHLQVLKKQSGRAINFFIEFFKDATPEQVLNFIKPNHNRLPERLHPAAWSVDASENVPFDELDDFELNNTLLFGF